MSKNIKGRVLTATITLVGTCVIGVLLNYLFLPAMNFQSSGFWWFMTFMGMIATALYFLVNGAFNYKYGEYGEHHMPGWVLLGALAIWLGVFIITAIAGGQMANGKGYSQITDVAEGNFKEEIKQIDVNDLIIVDVKNAQKVGDRTVGNIKNASWYEVDDEYNLILIKEEAYRISPLAYGGMFKYFKADDYGIPGYVLVNAKTQEAKYVALEEAMKYAPSAMFSYDLGRHLRNQYPSYIFGKSFFEVDDEGNPYWITGVKEPQIGMRGARITTSAVVTDAITGKSVEYKLNEIPNWIDHVDSVASLMEMVDWHYSLWDGWLNANFSKTQVYKTAYAYKSSEQSASEDEDKNDLAANEHTPFEGYNSIITEDGVMFYTGLTPANNAETNIGFLLINPRNQEITFYEADGAEESSAQGAVEGLVSDLRYSASFPTIVNVDGIETYFMVLKDGAGLIQRYAFVNIQNYAKCVQADTVEKALDLYKVEIGLKAEPDTGNDKPDNENNKPVVETIELSGKISQVQQAQVDGYTYYYFTIEGNDTLVYMSSIENSNLQPMKLQVGADVTIKYYESEKEDGIAIVTSIEFKTNY